MAYLEETLALARRGRARGGIGAIEMDDGSVRVFSRGTFAKDGARAAKIASEALDVFCREARISHPKIEAFCALPPGLRNA